MISHPTTLTRDDLHYARAHLDQGQVAEAYDSLAAKGYRYAILANGVVKGNSFSGRIALEFLDKTAQTQGRLISDDEIHALRSELAGVYLDTLGAQLTKSGDHVVRDVLADEAWTFHSEIFLKHQLDPDAWTLNTPFTLMDPLARETYWRSVLGSAGNMERELLLGAGTDLLMKHAALDVFAPEDSKRAISWLQRLHSLDTYLNTLSAAHTQLDLLADSARITAPAKTDNRITSTILGELLDSVDQIARRRSP